MTDLFATIVASETNDMPCLPIPDGPAHIPRARTHLPTSNVLALDLGTHCGWAMAKRDGAMDYGTESFHRLTGGAKWAEFRAWLSSAIKRHGVEVLYFEDVKAHGPGQVIAAHVYGGFLAMAQMVCHQHNVRMVGVGVKTVKKDFTGNGNANKEAIVAKAQDLGFRIGSKEHDTADALAILSYGVKQEAV
ncbi:MAG: crossover junction endodeoxyribonuclease RuvC [Cupriavidus sp.]|nr:crossover junction endodeoxyribonuclease RuvC [Cupriavidus sp.]